MADYQLTQTGQQIQDDLNKVEGLATITSVGSGLDLTNGLLTATGGGGANPTIIDSNPQKHLSDLDAVALGWEKNEVKGNYITWDGNITGRDVISMVGLGSTYKVSELTPSLSDLIGSTTINCDDTIIRQNNASLTLSQLCDDAGMAITEGDGTKLLIIRYLKPEVETKLFGAIALVPQTITVEGMGTFNVPSTGIYLKYSSDTNFYKTLVYGNATTWDGDTTGKTPVQILGMDFYKISDNKVDSLDDITHPYLTAVSRWGGESETTIQDAGNMLYTMTQVVTQFGGTVDSGDGDKAFVIYDGYELFGVISAVISAIAQTLVITVMDQTFTINTEPGTYFLKYDDGEDYLYTTNFNYVQASYELSKIPSRFIPQDSTKQDLLVSGTNIKTINNTSILGSGNIEIQGGGSNPDIIDSDKKLSNLSAIAVGYETAGKGQYLTWDGNISGRDCIESTGFGSLYKISKLTPSLADLTGAHVISSYRDRIYPLEDLQDFTALAQSEGFTITSGDGSKLLTAGSNSTTAVMIALEPQTIQLTNGSASYYVVIPSTGTYLGWTSSNSGWKALMYGNQIVWDGNTTGKSSITFNDITFYKVSDQKEDLVTDFYKPAITGINDSSINAENSDCEVVMGTLNALMSEYTLISGDPTQVFISFAVYKAFVNYTYNDLCIVSAINQTITYKDTNDVTYSLVLEQGTYFSKNTDRYVSSFNYNVQAISHEIPERFIPTNPVIDNSDKNLSDLTSIAVGYELGDTYTWDGDTTGLDVGTFVESENQVKGARSYHPVNFKRAYYPVNFKVSNKVLTIEDFSNGGIVTQTAINNPGHIHSYEILSKNVMTLLDWASRKNYSVTSGDATKIIMIDNYGFIAKSAATVVLSSDSETLTVTVTAPSAGLYFGKDVLLAGNENAVDAQYVSSISYTGATHTIDSRFIEVPTIVITSSQISDNGVILTDEQYKILSNPNTVNAYLNLTNISLGNWYITKYRDDSYCCEFETFGAIKKGTVELNKSNKHLSISWKYIHYYGSGNISINDAYISTTANAVSVSATGTATDEVQYITIDGIEKKLAGNNGPDNYIKNASISSNTLTLTKQDDSTVIYTPDLSSKQDLLVSGTNIKTINNTSLLGNGNIATSVVTGTNDGTNWQTLTIDGTTKNIPAIGVSSIGGATGAITLGNGLVMNSHTLGLKDTLSNDAKITISSASPTGGSSGDIWFQYDE